MERLRQTELREGMARMKAEAEAEEAKRFRAKIENDVQRKRMEQISPQSQSAVSTGNRHMRRSEDNENENGRGNRGDVIEEEEEEDDGYEEAEDFDDTEVEQAANQVRTYLMINCVNESVLIVLFCFVGILCVEAVSRNICLWKGFGQRQGAFSAVFGTAAAFSSRCAEPACSVRKHSTTSK